jgi:hypothetical protein
MLAPVVVEYHSTGMNIPRAPLSAVLFVFGYVGATDVWTVGCHVREYLQRVPKESISLPVLFGYLCVSGSSTRYLVDDSYFQDV